MVLGSSRFPESVTIYYIGDEQFELEPSSAQLFPFSAMATAGTIAVRGYAALYLALATAAATARTLPNRVAERYRAAIAGLPVRTEAERLVVQRIGQGVYRSALLDYWQGRCCVTGLSITELLRASHIKPWAECDSDNEQMDVFNGLLLSPDLDALFDGGWVTVRSDGEVLVSAALPDDACRLLGIRHNDRLIIAGLRPEHHRYLEYHRANVFRAEKLGGELAS